MTQIGKQGITFTHSGCYQWLNDYQQSLERDHAVYQDHENHWSWGRLGTFLAVIVAAIVFRNNLVWAGLGALVFLALFLFTVVRHTDWQNKRQFAEYLLTVLEESLHPSTEASLPVRSWQRPQDPIDPSMHLVPFSPSGSNWYLTGQELDDLDVYAAPVGIFGLLNRCSTEPGARRLGDMAETLLLSTDDIKQRQQMVRWLATNNQERLHIMASALPLRGLSDRLDQLAYLLKKTRANPSSRISLGIRLWSLVSGPLIAYGMLQVLLFGMSWATPLALLLLINVFIRRIFQSMFRFCWESMAPYTELVYTLRCFLFHAEQTSRTLTNESSLGELKTCFSSITEAKIPSICQWLDMAKLGAIVRHPLELAIFYDLHVAEAVLKPIVTHRRNLRNGLAALAELEALNSLACFASESTTSCYPQLSTDVQLDIKAGRHPLLPDGECIPNDVHMTPEQRTWVITGPNAAGKSTFLRMVGVHCLLAQIGSAVPAESMTFSPFRLITDVRVRDDLAKHESYFLSEVRRLRRIIMDRIQKKRYDRSLRRSPRRLRQSFFQFVLVPSTDLKMDGRGRPDVSPDKSGLQ